MSNHFLTALPVFDEARYVGEVLDQVCQYAEDVLVVDDGSTDGTPALLAKRSDICVVTHPENQGYGAALKTAFDYAVRHGYEILVTIDCDGQHEPQRIPRFVTACQHADIVSGSRYLKQYPGDSPPPAQRRRINQLVTADINHRLRLKLTDAFCGFKAYRAEALRRLSITETGYAMPLELWVQAAHAGLRIIELPVPLVYLDEKRSFGGMLDDAATRLEYYRRTIDRSIAAVQRAARGARAGSLCKDGAG